MGYCCIDIDVGTSRKAKVCNRDRRRRDEGGSGNFQLSAMLPSSPSPPLPPSPRLAVLDRESGLLKICKQGTRVFILIRHVWFFHPNKIND